MKRTLLLSATFLFAMGSFAQLLTQKTSVRQLPRLMKQEQIATTASKKPSAVNRLKKGGIYYVKPYGTFYGGWDTYEHTGFYYSTVIMPAFQELTFVNKSTGKVSWVDRNNEPVEADENGNYTDMWYRQSGSAWYLPSVMNRRDRYTLGEWNFYMKRYPEEFSDYIGGLARTDSISSMWLADPLAAYEYEGTFYTPGAIWGGIDSSDNMYGSGELTYENEDGSTYTGVAYAAAQCYFQPAAPLFINEVIVNGETFTQPIPEGKQLVAYITKAHKRTFTFSDGSTEEGLIWDLDNVLDTLYASSADTLDFVTEESRNEKTIKMGSVVFTKPGEVDAFGNVAPAPILVRDTFAIVISGFDQEGVDLGIDGIRVPDEEVETTCNGRFLVYDKSNPTDSWFHSYSNCAMDIVIRGMFDKAVAPKVPGMYTFESDELDYRIVRVPTTGSVEEYGLSNMTEGATASAFITGELTDPGYPGVPVFTNCSWFDEEENPNYAVLNMPDWITSVLIDPSLYEDTYGMNIVMFQADPLPAGVTGRVAEMQVVGQYVDGDDFSTVSETIYVVQGDADINAIEQVRTQNKANGHVYNLSGQRVMKADKGLFIRDGKKFLRK